jgi:hypothetical protein
MGSGPAACTVAGTPTGDLRPLAVMAAVLPGAATSEVDGGS